jgi:hypothetical protein
MRRAAAKQNQLPRLIWHPADNAGNSKRSARRRQDNGGNGCGKFGIRNSEFGIWGRGGWHSAFGKGVQKRGEREFAFAGQNMIGALPHPIFRVVRRFGAAKHKRRARQARPQQFHKSRQYAGIPDIC